VEVKVVKGGLRSCWGQNQEIKSWVIWGTEENNRTGRAMAEQQHCKKKLTNE